LCITNSFAKYQAVTNKQPEEILSYPNPIPKMADVHNINQQNDPSQWFKSLPFVTQTWFGATMALTLSGNFGIIDIKYLFWNWYMIRNRLELWRVVTSFCYAGPFDFSTLITICKCHAVQCSADAIRRHKDFCQPYVKWRK
jgi:hypothetical protein